MSKKNKKNRELDRLQNLYQPTSDISSTTTISEVSEAPVANREELQDEKPEASEFLSSTKQTTKHVAVKRDLGFLSILILIMVVLLFGINYLAANSNFGDWITKLFGGIF